MSSYVCKNCGSPMTVVKVEKVIEMDHGKASFGSCKMKRSGHPYIAAAVTATNIGVRAINHFVKKKTCECTGCGRVTTFTGT